MKYNIVPNARKVIFCRLNNKLALMFALQVIKFRGKYFKDIVGQMNICVLEMIKYQIANSVHLKINAQNVEIISICNKMEVALMFATNVRFYILFYI